MKRTIILFSFFLLANLCNAQLLINNNVLITINSGAQLTVKGDVLNNFGTVIDNYGIIDLSGNWINNSGNVIFGTSAGAVVMNGINQNIEGADATRFHALNLHNGTKTLQVDVTTGGIGFPTTGDLNCNDAVLDLNSHTLTINNPGLTAITNTTGYILSEDIDNSSKVFWANPGTFSHTIPFGNNLGEDVSFGFTGYPPAGGVPRSIIVSTYRTAPNNAPLPTTPVLVTHVRNLAGVNNSANTVDRFWHLEKSGLFDFAFTYAPSENAANGNSNMRAQQWSTTNLGWNMPLTGQSNPTSQQVFVPAVPFVSPFAMEGATWTIASQSSPLPIELLSFTATAKNNSEVVCNWTTASETNNDYFLLLRSQDGLHFEEVEKINGAGNSNALLNYSFIDKNPYSGISYYRLKQVDFNGDFSYSQIEKVRIANEGFIYSVYPNPTKGFLFIQFERKTTGFATFEVTDVSGKIIKQGILNIGLQTQKIYLNELASGFYFIGVKCEGRCFNKKIQLIK